MARPWTGRPPLPESNKKLKEFDSFVLPPHGKKGIKPVQAPGPFLEGTGPRYVKTREELLGEPLTKEEVEQLVRGCVKSKRQLNMGRDGLTHNMLDNIHTHGKRQSAQEEKIIHSRGGVIYLFRGRNYNYKTRPRFPLMLWKPASPVYPRLLKRVPEGLTLDEVTEMRRKGRELIPICKLGKNGVYCDLVKNVQEAFQECELVKINCEGMNRSDYKKIGAKLQDLVPCVLISFAKEHILMWRGRQPSPPLPSLKDYLLLNNQPDMDDTTAGVQAAEHIEVPSPALTSPSEAVAVEPLKPIVPPLISENPVDLRSSNKVPCPEIDGNGAVGIKMLSSIRDTDVSEVILSEDEVSLDACLRGMQVSEVIWSERGNEIRIDACITDTVSEDIRSEDENGINFDASIIDGNVSEDIRSEDVNEITSDAIIRDGDVSEVAQLEDENQVSLDAKKYEDGALNFSENTSSETTESELSSVLESRKYNGTPTSSSRPCTEKLLLLLEKAVKDGTALMLEESAVDSDTVFQRAVSFSRTAPPNPVFMPRPKRVVIQATELDEEKDLQLDIAKDELNVENYGRNRQQGKRYQKRKDRDEIGSSSRISQGSLRIDELAKLLA